MVTQQSKAGFIIAVVGGIAGLLSFFFMPYLSYSFVSVTGQQLASLGNQVSSYSALYGNGTQQFNGLLLLWLIPIVSGLITLIAGVQLFKSPGNATVTGRKVAGGWLIVLAALPLIGMGGVYIYLTNQIQGSTFPTVSLGSLIGTGLWVLILAMIAVIVGGAMATRTKASPTSFSSQQSWPPSQTQYPPFPQQLPRPGSPPMNPPQHPESWRATMQPPFTTETTHCPAQQ